MKYLFFDIDGTLLSHEKGVIKSTVKALKMAKENGHKIFICTGRALSEISEKMYTFDFDGVICASGGYVKIGDEVIYNKIMPDHLVENMMYFMDKLDMPYVLEGTEKTYTHPNILDRFIAQKEKYIELRDKYKYENAAYYFHTPRTTLLEDYLENKTPISKATIYGETKEDLIELKKYIDNDFDLINYGTAGELIAKDVNKFTGIQLVIKNLGGNIRDTYAFGDSLNDYEMVRGCQVGVAMGNASDVLKGVADYITTTTEDDGIFNALKHFELI